MEHRRSGSIRLRTMWTIPWTTVATSHADRLAGNEGGVVTGQEADRARDVLGLADALHRNGADQGGAHLLAALAFAGGGRQQRGLGGAGTDVIERDAPARHLARHRL